MFEPDDYTQEELDSVHSAREREFERKASASRDSRYVTNVTLQRQRAAAWLQEHGEVG